MSTHAEKMAVLRALHVRRSADEYDHLIHDASFSSASPIESLFLAGMLATQWQPALGAHAEAPYSMLIGLGLDLRTDWSGVAVLHQLNPKTFAVTQLPLRLEDRKIVVDIAVFLWTGQRFAIELDGHDFHERTKEQAARDKSRDRLLTKAGWSPLRFTGSEVWADPVGCATELRRTIVAAMTRHNNPEGA